MLYYFGKLFYFAVFLNLISVPAIRQPALNINPINDKEEDKMSSSPTLAAVVSHFLVKSKTEAKMP